MPTLFLTKALKIYDGEKTASSTNVVGKVVICLQKTETRYMFITLYYYQLKMDQGPQYQTQNSKVGRGQSRKHSRSYR
jgi:hypothetical protein